MSRAALALLLGVVAGALAATQPLSDTDMWWHIATGRETLAHGLVRADVFSWTVRGAPISTDQWLGQVLMYAAYAFGDWWGVAILRVISVIALVSLVGVNVSLARAIRPLPVVLATMPALLLTRPVWVDRPELLGFVLFAALLVLLRLGRDGRPRPLTPRWDGRKTWDRRKTWDGRTVSLAAVVLLCFVWANVHGSFALGVVITVLVCAEGAARDPARRKVYLACAAASILASFLTPAGPGTWTAPGIHLLTPPRDIQEWNVVDVRTPLGAAYVVTLGVVIACVLLGRRLALRELVVLVPVAFLSLTAARQAPLLAIVAAPLFADRAASAMSWLEHARATETRATTAQRSGPGVATRPGAPAPGALGRAGTLSMSALLPATLLIASLLAAPRQPDEHAYPVAAIASHSIPSGDGVLARYEWGGWLIWQGVPVFVDGRLTPYAGVLDDYRRVIAAAPGWRDVLARRSVRTLLVVPSDPVAVRAKELGWRVLGASDTFVLIAVP